jgi:hypothetical protein
VVGVNLTEAVCGFIELLGSLDGRFTDRYEELDSVLGVGWTLIG